MPNYQDKRLENLEAETPERPDMVALFSEPGGEDAARAKFYRDTPEDQWPNLLVVVAR